METLATEDQRRLRMSMGHYVGLQIFAIVLPPAVFLLCYRLERPPKPYLRRSILLLAFFWIPSVVYATMFLRDVYRVSHQQPPHYFEPKHMPRSPNASSHRRSTTSDPNADEPNSGIIDEDADTTAPTRQISQISGPDTPASGSSTQQNRSRFSLSLLGRSSLTNISNISLPVSTAISSLHIHASEAKASKRYKGHKSRCAQCTKCSKCFMDHVRHMEAIRKTSTTPLEPFIADPSPAEDITSDHSREKHLRDKHHVPQCLCRSCTGKSPPGGRGMHADGCVCDLCKRPGLGKKPRERFRWRSDEGRYSGVYAPGAALAMGMAAGMGGVAD